MPAILQLFSPVSSSHKALVRRPLWDSYISSLDVLDLTFVCKQVAECCLAFSPDGRSTRRRQEIERAKSDQPQRFVSKGQR